MQFIKDIAGGVVIILVAGVLGIIVNATRERPAKLILDVPPAVASKGDSSHDKKESPSTSTPVAEEEMSTVPILTDDEVLTGEISLARVLWLIEAETIVLIDARGVSEYIDGHLPDAINIPYENFVDYYDTLIESVAMDADVVCYCRSVDCDLSEDLAQEMRLMGYQRVTCYRGGVMEWEEAGHALNSPK